MLIFWHQGGLHIEPEGEFERKALVALVENAKFGKPKKPVVTTPTEAGAGAGADKMLKTLGERQTGSPGSSGSSSSLKKPDPKRPDSWWSGR
jgi:hypothetical protein